MLEPTNNGTNRTVSDCLDIYERWEHQSTLIGGGVGVLLVAGGLASNAFNATPFFAALFISVALVAGFCAARARVGLSFQLHKLNSAVSHNRIELDSKVTDEQFLSRERRFLQVGAYLVGVMGLILVVAAWWAVFTDDSDKTCTIKWRPGGDHVIICAEGD